jgi:protoheme IX farnesyltransferase
MSDDGYSPVFAEPVCAETNASPVASVVMPGTGPTSGWRTYLKMTRPRVIALVLMTGLPALALGPRWPSVAQLFWVLLGTSLVGAACSALNAYLERDVDALMARTRRRPLPAGVVDPTAGLRFGLVTTVASTAILAWQGGLLAALLGAGTIAFYVGVYTAFLKRRTPLNIVIGGAAGGTAPLILDAAVNGTITPASLIVFTVVFLWTPPHFWAVAIYRRREYEAAGIPMMPSVVGETATRWRMLGYALVLVPVSMLPAALGLSSWAYGFVAAALGGWFCGRLFRFLRVGGPTEARGVFQVSNLYLLLLVLAICGDASFVVS